MVAQQQTAHLLHCMRGNIGPKSSSTGLRILNPTAASTLEILWCGLYKGPKWYKKFFPGPNSTNIVFIDTEGIDALDANDTHDVRIFTLALLLSVASFTTRPADR